MVQVLNKIKDKRKLFLLVLNLIFFLFVISGVSTLRKVGIVLLFLPGITLMEIFFEKRNLLEKLCYGVLLGFSLSIVLTIWLNLVLKIKLNRSFPSILFLIIIVILTFSYLFKEKGFPDY